MKNKGSVFIGIFVLIAFLLICYGCVVTIKQQAGKIEAYDKAKAEERNKARAAEKAKEAKRKAVIREEKKKAHEKYLSELSKPKSKKYREGYEGGFIVGKHDKYIGRARRGLWARANAKRLADGTDEEKADFVTGYHVGYNDGYHAAQ